MPSTLLVLLALGATPEAALTPTPCAETAGPRTIEVKAGARLRSAPDAASRSVGVVDVDVSLPVSSRCGAWAEVRWGGFRAWVTAGDVAGPSLERTPLPVDPARLTRVKEALRPLGREIRLGPWRVVTEVATGELTGLDAVASQLADTYAARYGVPTGADPGQAVVIFASEDRYRRFAKADGSPMFRTKGHAGAGLAAFVLGRNPLETRVIFVHEVTHLLSRNALGEGLPAWLDEGIAEDLAWCRTDAAGRLLPDTLDVFESARRESGATSVERSGPRVSADDWLARARTGRIPPLSALCAPGSRLLSDPGARRDAASQSAMLVRFCLATPERARRFREFLKIVSLGGPGDARSLAETLETDEQTLSKDFLKWAQAGPPAR